MRVSRYDVWFLKCKRFLFHMMMVTNDSNATRVEQDTKEFQMHIRNLAIFDKVLFARVGSLLNLFRTAIIIERSNVTASLWI